LVATLSGLTMSLGLVMPRLLRPPVVAAFRLPPQHTYRALKPVDRFAAELQSILKIHRHEPRAIEHEPR
jgi:hypothetical protein